MEEKILERSTQFSGKLLRLEVVQVELADGSRGMREIVYHPNAVCAAVLTVDKKWVFVRQYRVPAEELLLEVPAGKIDPGEDADEAVIRELQEEIGYKSGKVQKLMQFWSTPGFCNERMTAYLVSEAVLDTRHVIEDEFLEVEQVPLEEGIAMALDGRLSDAKSVAALLAGARVLGV
jgi:ADP-ribose pyrophosphatase